MKSKIISILIGMGIMGVLVGCGQAVKTVQADTNIENMTIEDADNYLKSAIDTHNSLDGSIRQASIAQAIYAKKTYELLKEKK
jgi:alpha-glucuronidase